MDSGQTTINAAERENGQRALMAARAKAKYEEAARQRQLSGLKQNQTADTVSAESALTDDPPADQGKAAARAAEQVGVSPRAAEQGKRILDHGDPQLTAAVRRQDGAVADDQRPCVHCGRPRGECPPGKGHGLCEVCRCRWCRAVTE